MPGIVNTRCRLDTLLIDGKKTTKCAQPMAKSPLGKPQKINIATRGMLAKDNYQTI